MKINNQSVLLVFLLIFFRSSIILGQTYNGSVTLSTQAEVDNFGAFGYTDITHDVWIISSYDIGTVPIHDLSSLNNLVNIGGEFLLKNNPISTLQGLNDLTSIGSHFSIWNNDRITDLSGLENLTTISDELLIYKNDSLTTLNGLNNLSVAGEGIKIGHNPELIDLANLFEGFTNLEELTIEYNNSLTSISQLDNITSINGYTRIGDNPKLASLDGFNNITHIGGQLRIVNNDSLTSLAGLESLSCFHETLGISNNLRIKTLIELSNIDSVKYLVINGNDSLENFNGLQNISYVNGNLVLKNNPSLNSLNGLNNIESVLYSIFLEESNLETLDGLENLLSVGYDFNIKDNSLLDDYCGISNLVLNNGIQSNDLIVENNLYNPSLSDIDIGDCIECLSFQNSSIILSTAGFQIDVLSLLPSNASFQWLNCDDDYAIIPGETSNSYTPISYGNFAVQVIVDNCIDTSNCLPIEALDVFQANLVNSITVSPTITTGSISVNFGLLENKNMRVINQLGQIIHQEHNISKSNYHLNLPTPEGIYTIEVFSNRLTKQFKVIKN